MTFREAVGNGDDAAANNSQHNNGRPRADEAFRQSNGQISGDRDSAVNGHDNMHGGTLFDQQTGDQTDTFTVEQRPRSKANGANGTHRDAAKVAEHRFTPIAVCGMACRLPGGISCPQEFWDFLLAGKDARQRVPTSRYNAHAHHSAGRQPGTVISEFGYFLDEKVDLGAVDLGCFPMAKAEAERIDPQQKILLEVAREAIDDAGEVHYRGRNIGVYAGSYGNDWYDVFHRDPQQHSVFQLHATQDFMPSQRISHQLDLRGPSMTLRTACSSAMIGLHEASLALARGDCESAIVAGSNLVMSPSHMAVVSENGAFSPDGSCNTFSSKANGYARADGFVAVYIKTLESALRDGNPIRAVLSGTATNYDGQTSTLSMPSSAAQSALIKRAYEVAGISNYSATGLVECHGTGTAVGDVAETDAIASIFGESGVVISSTKPNIGHTDGASGITSLIKAILCLENRTIPPSIKNEPRNPKIKWEHANLQAPLEAMMWPENRAERVSINCFGIGGANAHVIVESAGLYKTAARNPTKRAPTEAPQLLVYSATSVQSLKSMTKQYQSFLEKRQLSASGMIDLVHTLATRRRHKGVKYRAFAIFNKGALNTQIPATRIDISEERSMIMVFTGQGAQWPQMGRELLRHNSVFLDTIRALDGHLRACETITLGWTIEEELKKPPRKSRVKEAEFSQPLCTAVQIALVDCYAALRIKAKGVIGHSSGEIAAAYAAGALTAREAILVAVLRGHASAMQKSAGSMAAIGTSWSTAEKFLRAGVVLACENSHSSVTLSGDTEVLETVVADIREKMPETSVNLLKVDKAYHSPHMAAIGDVYEQFMTDAGVCGTTNSLPFFSSVSGDLVDTKANVSYFGPKYWRANLQNPVLFRGALEKLLRTVANPVLLEIGPHPALAGPIRQTLTNQGLKVPQIASMLRGEDSAENFLTSIGHLFSLHVPVDLAALTPNGAAISGLPPYPWDRKGGLYYESRVSREWRQANHPYHNLLGRKTLESTDFEPSWRNMLHLRNVPWAADHMIHSDIVLPFTAYVSMAAEAIEQISASGQHAIKFKNVTVRSPMLLQEDKPIELVTVFRRQRLTDGLDSDWWEFSISSHNGNVWVKNCTGNVRVEAVDLTDIPTLHSFHRHPRKVEAPKWYDMLHRKGLTYGPTFNILTDICVSATDKRHAEAVISRNDQSACQIDHTDPCLMDAMFQISTIAASKGIQYQYRLMMATSVESLVLYGGIGQIESPMTIVASAETIGTDVVGSGSCFAGTSPWMQFTGARSTAFEDRPLDSGSEFPITARSEWVPDVDFLDLGDLLHAQEDLSRFGSMLSRLSMLAARLTSHSSKGLNPSIVHLQRYQKWLNEGSDLNGKFNDETASQEMFSLQGELAGTSVEHIAQIITEITTKIPAILSGEQQALTVLSSCGYLQTLQDFMVDYDGHDLSQHLAHSKPNLRVLELEAGSGTATSGIIKSLKHAQGQSLYGHYTFADRAVGMVTAAKERFYPEPNMDFVVFDLDKDPDTQDLGGQAYDLIIATNALNRVSSLSKALGRLHKLLAPGGRLFLQEPRSGLHWVKFILGTLPTWWRHAEDKREQEPFATRDRLVDELNAAGFERTDIVKSDTDAGLSSDVFVAKKSPSITESSAQVTVLYRGDVASTKLYADALLARGYIVSLCDFDATLHIPVNQDVLSLLDFSGPFFADVHDVAFEKMKAMLLNIANAGVLWLTSSSSVECRDPLFGQAIGFARVLRSELAIDLATLEIDEVGLPTNVDKAIDIFRRFQRRQKDQLLGPDFEYVLHSGMVRVHRIFPISVDRQIEDEAHHNDHREAILSIERPGRIDILQWCAKSSEAPRDDEVEMEVHAVGLNFRDIMVATKLLEQPETMFGYEGAGIVRRVGRLVSRFEPGDRVVYCGSRAFATTFISSELLFEKLPDSLSFIEGASMPLAFATALYGLVDVGRLEAGQSVLIHSAAGGVGLAAIQIAQMSGATILATVSSDTKAAFLEEEYGIPRSHIFDSRSTKFERDVRAIAPGGVDLALNSLSGDLLHATWSCIAKWGTMVEIGKRDLDGNGRLDMAGFLGNRTYSCIDLNAMCQERPKLISRLLERTVIYLREGRLRPLPIAHVYPGKEVSRAFLDMRHGKHIGKIVIELLDSSNASKIGRIANRPQDMLFEPDASYVLVGGLGGIGRSVSIWMVEHGARHLIFLARSAGDIDEHHRFAEEMESMGCSVQLVKGNVAIRADVARALEKSDHPIKGIINMTMALRDVAYREMTVKDWRSATESKVQGTWNLHDVAQSASLDLNFFVAISSVSGIVGLPGQANYAAANSFLDAFVDYRSSQGLPCSGIILGLMENVGYYAEDEGRRRKMQGQGWRMLQETELFSALAAAMESKPPKQASNATGLGIASPNKFLLGICLSIPLKDPKSSALLRSDTRLAFYHNTVGTSNSESTRASGLREFITSAMKDPKVLEEADGIEFLATEIGKKLLSLLLEDDKQVSASTSTTDLGLDSMLAVELRAWWKLSFGLDISALELQNVGTLGGLGKRAAEGLRELAALRVVS